MVFIDIGGWEGSSIKKALSVWNCNVFSFEPHPENFEKLKELESEKVTIINKAAWIFDGKVKLYQGSSQAHTLYKSKTTGDVDPNNWIEVECIDIADWIIENLRPDWNIIMKLNCEGAEYEIIPHLKNHGLLRWVNEWYVQWHWSKIGLDKKRHEKVKSMIPKCTQWNA